MANSSTPINQKTKASLSDSDLNLPKHLDAERAVLGAILVDNDAYARVSALLRPLDFFLTQHKVIFQRIREMMQAGVSVDLLTLVESLQREEKIDQAGGPAYVSQLSDGIPRVSHVEHWARIVAEKSRLRQMIYAADAIYKQALAPDANPVEIEKHLTETAETLSRPLSDNPAVVVGIRDLLTMEMPELQYAITPLLTVGGTGEIFAWRGTGKSLFASELAIELARGSKTLFEHPRMGGNWKVEQRMRVLYVYGEMHGTVIQKRLRQLAKGHGLNDVPENEYLGTMCKDFQKAWRPNISTSQNRRFLEERIFGGGYNLVILDNISTLWPTSQDTEGDRTATLTDWYMDLNQRGVAVIYIHHAGKNGDQRGSSEKQDMLDFSLKLAKPSSRKEDSGLCAIVSIEKMRNECKEPQWMMPFEIQLKTVDDASHWLVRPAKDAQLSIAFELFTDGMKPSEIFPDIGVSRPTAYRYFSKYKQNPDPKAWTGTESE